MAKTPKLAVRDISDVPLREVSGLAVRERHLLAVGDHDPVLFTASLDTWPLRWEAIDLSGLGVVDGAVQFEAVESVGGDAVLVLQEQPARILHLQLGGPSLIGTISLEVPAGHPLRESWLGDRSSRGEAMVLTAGGHLIVVKEKNPTAILEFGPAGDAPLGWRRGAPASGTSSAPCAGFAPPSGDATWPLLATWSLSGALAEALPDVSDAAIGPDGALYLLSDQGAAIARLPDDLAPHGGVVEYGSWWRIAGGPAKAEGLAILADGTPLVALDTKSGRRNLLRLQPLPD